MELHTLLSVFLILYKAKTVPIFFVFAGVVKNIL